MGLDQDEYNELIRKHTEGDYKKSDPIGELQYIFKIVLKSGIIGIILYFGIGILFSIIRIGNISGAELIAEELSFYGLVISGILYAISYYAGSKMFLGEMSRRAWTNSQKMDEKSTMDDLKSMVSGGQFMRNMFFGSLISFTLFYLVIK